MNPVTLAPQTQAWAVVGVLVWTGLVGAAGWMVGTEQENDRRTAEVSQLKKQYADDKAQAVAQEYIRYQQETLRGARLEQALRAADARHAADKKAIKETIHHVTTVYKPSLDAPAIPLPHCIFTAGWVRQYNAAAGLPEVGAPTSASPTGATPDTTATPDAWLLDSGVSQADILAHRADDAERCRGLESQVNGLLDYLEADDGSI